MRNDDSYDPPDATEPFGGTELMGGSESMGEPQDAPGNTGNANPSAPGANRSAGIVRVDHRGAAVWDAMAGRASLFGFGFAPLAETLHAFADRDWGDPLAAEQESDVELPGVRETPDGHDAAEEHESTERSDVSERLRRFAESVRRIVGDDFGVRCDSLVVTESADGAIETAIRFARLRGGDERYRTVALVGADHGHTGMCRSASGIPERQRGFGPLMPGFDHVAAGDAEALERTIGEQTACVLLSPVDWTDGCRPLDPEFLRKAAACCQERDVMLVIDETRACFAASGQPFSFREIAEIEADGVAVAGGLFGGLPGGLLIASSRLTGTAMVEADRFPLQTELARTTMAELANGGLIDTARDSARPIATRLAESIGGFEFVRDLHVLGLTIGIESDLPSGEWVAALRRFGVRVEAAGDHAVRIQLPLTITPEQTEELMRRTVAALEALEGQATVTSTDEASASP